MNQPALGEIWLFTAFHQSQSQHPKYYDFFFFNRKSSEVLLGVRVLLPATWLQLFPRQQLTAVFAC